MAEAIGTTARAGPLWHARCTATEAMKRILVGLDNSPRAPAVLAEAVKIASAQPGCLLILFHAMGLPHEAPASGHGREGGVAYEELVKTARAELDALGARAPKALVESVEVLLGVPWQSICDEAKEREVDLIVIGSHGYGGLDRVLGTTAAKVVDHADCSVLVVRQASERRAQRARSRDHAESRGDSRLGKRQGG
jgi:nucleotide-binding universal stress UspA family protein